MAHITVTNSQEALQMPQDSSLPFIHHWPILVSGKLVLLSDTCPGPCCSMRKVLPSLMVPMKLMDKVSEKGTGLFSKAHRRRNVMLYCLPVNGLLLSTEEKYGCTSMAGIC